MCDYKVNTVVSHSCLQELVFIQLIVLPIDMQVDSVIIFLISLLFTFIVFIFMARPLHLHLLSSLFV